MSAGESVPPPVAERTPAGSPQGSLLAIGGGIAFGTLGIFGTLFYDHGGSNFALLVLRFCGAAVVLGAIALLRHGPTPAWSDVALATLCGFGLLGATFCLFAGFKEASPGLVTLLFYIYPLLVTLGDRVLFGVVLGRRRALVLGAGLIGIALTVGVPGSATTGAVLAGLGAGVISSGYILLGRHVLTRSLDAFQFVAIEFTGAGILIALIGVVVGFDWPPSAAIPSAVGLILLSSVVPVLLFYSAIPLIGAGSAARLATVEPVTSVILSYIVLGDTLIATQIVGGAIVVASVVLLAKP